MKVFSKATGETLLIGRCDVPDDADLAFDVPLFGPKTEIMERFGIGEVVIFKSAGDYTVERGVLLVPGQDPALLPGWQPLAS